MGDTKISGPPTGSVPVNNTSDVSNVDAGSEKIADQSPAPEYKAPAPMSHAAKRTRVAEREFDGTVRTAHLKNLADKPIAVGQQIATVDNKPVTVAKELGPPAGFKTRFEALAYARGVSDGSAALYMDGKKQWHVVQTKPALSPGKFSADPKAKGLQHVDKPNLQQWNDAQKTIDKLKQQGLTISDPALQDAYRDKLAAALGVSPNEIKIIRSKDDVPDPNMINFDPNLESLGHAGAAKLDGKPRALVIGRGDLAFDNPQEAITTAFHEATHVRHNMRSNELYAKWEGIQGKKPNFTDWLEDQYKNKKNDVTLEDLVTTQGKYLGGSNASEAVSYLNGFMATFAVDRKDDKLINSALAQAVRYKPYHNDLKQEFRTAFENDLKSRLKNFYQGLDEHDRARFKIALEKAQHDYPNSYIKDFKLN